MNSSQYYPSPFVSMRIGASATAFYDLFTGRQLVLAEPAGSALASVFKKTADFGSFLSQFPAEANQALSLSLFVSEPPPGPYLRAMLSSLDIEPAGSCNAVCGMCPRGSMTRPKTVMTTATFDAICGQLAESFPQVVKRIFFCGFGEPLQNPMLGEMSRRIRSCAQNCSITVISNGSLLTDEMIGSLVRSEIDVFSCSFQSNSKRKYESIMRGLNYETTVTGLRKLIAASHGSRLKVCINMTATEENTSEIPAMAAAWKQYGAQVVVNPLHNRGGFLKLDGRDQAGMGSAVARCGLMNSRLFISSEGDVLSCCHDIAGGTRIGNIASEPLTEILHRRLNRIARSELYPICGRCDDESAQVLVPLHLAAK